MTTKKTDELVSFYKQFAESQRRQQVSLVVALCVVIAIATALYTWITWESVAARREANDLQRQLIELQRAGPPSKAALAQHSDVRRAVQVNAASHRAPSRTHPSEQDSPPVGQTEIDGKALSTPGNSISPSSHTWSTRNVVLSRPGRQ